jgi:hypothetical protein
LSGLPLPTVLAMTRPVRIQGLILAALLLSGCRSVDSSATASPTFTVVPSPTPTTLPTPVVSAPAATPVATTAPPVASLAHAIAPTPVPLATVCNPATTVKCPGPTTPVPTVSILHPENYGISMNRYYPITTNGRCCSVQLGVTRGYSISFASVATANPTNLVCSVIVPASGCSFSAAPGTSTSSGFITITWAGDINKTYYVHVIVTWFNGALERRWDGAI